MPRKLPSGKFRYIPALKPLNNLHFIRHSNSILLHWIETVFQFPFSASSEAMLPIQKCMIFLMMVVPSSVLAQSDGLCSFPGRLNSVLGDPVFIASADLDGDCDVDFVVANRFSDNVSVLFNNGNGIFTSSFVLEAGDSPVGISIADLDGDSDMDIIVCSEASDAVFLFHNNGSGQFSDGVSFPTAATPRAVTAADFDNDGQVDIATADANGGGISDCATTVRVDFSPP